MRLDHFVLHNNHLTTTKGDTMSDNSLSNSLSNNGANMSDTYNLETPSVTLSRGYGSSHTVWADMHKNSLVGTGKRIYGRIQDTGCNYIIEGWNMNGEWVRVPCRRLIDAQVLLAKVMDKDIFLSLRS